MSRRKRGRNVNGIVILDKPLGMSSNAALQEVKKLYFARKAGHTGSLDPLATGILPICFGEATKISSFLFDAPKRYTAMVKLGETTTTGDLEGDIVETRPVEAFDEARIKSVLAGFNGEIEQIPPMFSALKHQGQPLYKLAREGIEIERQPRKVTIYELNLLGMSANSIEIDVKCSRGTYIRTLAEDIGAELGCGAHLQALRRTGLGPYAQSDMVSVDTLRQQDAEHKLAESLTAIDTALVGFPEVQLSENVAYYLKQGQPVVISGAPTAGLVRLYEDSGFLGIGKILDDGRVAPKRLMNLPKGDRKRS